MAPLDTGLEPSTAPDAALRHIVADCRTDLLKYRAVVLASRRPIGIHQTRVALRRLRAAFGLFRHAVDGPVVRALSAEAKWLAGECAPARDLHVVLTETAEDVPAVIERVARRLADAHLQRARAALAGARFEAFDRQINAFLDLSPAALSDRLDEFAEDELDAHHDKVVKRGRRIETLDEHRLHKLRIAIKKLRYAASYLRPAFASATFASSEATPYIEATVRLQNALGALNDRAVARSVLADLATAARPTEDVAKPLKRLARQVASARNAAGASWSGAWQAFRAVERFWRA